MAFFNEFPNARTYDSDLGWLIATVKKLIDRIDGYNEVHFADPIAWSISTQYDTATIVRDPGSGDLYISKQPVPNGILITNTAYWEPLGLGGMQTLCEIINVADYGATGVPGADYTTEIQNAINDGHILYFPAGEYSFKGVTSSKPLFIFGDGEATIWKPQHRIVTSNQYATMLASADDLTLASIKIEGDNSVVSQTGTQYYQSAIIQQSGGRFRMTGCTIDQIFDTYHLSQGDLAFPDRNGLLLYATMTDSAEIDHCTFKEYGGEELIWISRTLATFGDETSIWIHDNMFRDRVMLDNGGQIDGGSAINVLGGDIKFYNNICDNYYQRGSFVNLLGNNIEAFNNAAYDCDMGSWLDMSEGYYSKSHTVNVHNNYFEDKNGKTSFAVKFMAVNATIKDNHLEGSCPVKSYGLTDATQNTSGQSYIGDNTEWPIYELIDVSGNTLILTHDAPNLQNCGISLAQTNQVLGSRGRIDRIVIENNKMYAKSAVSTYYNTLFVQGSVKEFIIKGNSFPFGGASSPSLTQSAFICVNENNISGDYVLIDGNYFDQSVNTQNVRVFQSIAATITNITGVCVHNTLNASGTSRVFAVSTATGFEGDYNYNFTAIK